MPTIIAEPTIKPEDVLNIDLSITSALCSSLRLLSARLITTINNIKIMKTSVIRSINGRSGKKPFDHPGRNLKTVESGMVRIAEVRAAFDVVRFQKNPKRKMESTPGEIKPTYS